jgi:hypothetical protein
VIAKRLTACVALLATGTTLAACGGEEKPASGPNPQPGFYLTARNAADLERQATAAGARFARSQGRGEAVMVLDFGAARRRDDGVYGAALRSGTFFTNREIAGALQAAARGYDRHHQRGSVTIVYANSNAFLSRPGRGYTPFDEQIAREAGQAQAKTLEGLELSSNQRAAVGGDIEPGYDLVGKPEISIALVRGANSASGRPYYDVGTAPCEGDKCVNGWAPSDVCEVAGGEGRVVLPEIYFDEAIDQPAQWAAMQKTCEIDTFAGVSASPVGSFSPKASWDELRGKTPARVEPVIVVWPG